MLNIKYGSDQDAPLPLKSIKDDPNLEFCMCACAIKGPSKAHFVIQHVMRANYPQYF